MADSYIAVAPDSTGKKLQTFENTIGGQVVEAEAVTLVDSSGAELTEIPVTGTFFQATQPVSIAGAIPVTDNSGSLTVDGTVGVSGNVTVVQGTATNLKVDASGVAVPVTDNSGSLTVDNNGTFAVQASIAAAQTLANVTTVGTITNVVHVDDNSSTLSVDDGGGSITVDGTVTATPTGTYTTKETRASTSARTSVANATSDTSLLAANSNRLGATIFNDDTAGTGATLKIALDTSVSTTSFTAAIAPQGYYEVPFNYTGAIRGIASAATGNARITELTA